MHIASYTSPICMSNVDLLVVQQSVSCSPFTSRNIHPEANLLTLAARMKWIEDCQTYWSHVLICFCSAGQPEERRCSVVWWFNSRYFCIFCQVTAGWPDCGCDGCCWHVASPDDSLSMGAGDFFLITGCRAFLSGARQEPCWFPDRMLSIAPL